MTFLHFAGNTTATFSAQKYSANKFSNESFLLHKSIVETTYLFTSLMDQTVTKYYDDIVSK